MKLMVKWPIVLFLLSISTAFAAESPATQAESDQPETAQSDKASKKSQTEKTAEDYLSDEAEPDCD